MSLTWLRIDIVAALHGARTWLLLRSEAGGVPVFKFLKRFWLSARFGYAVYSHLNHGTEYRADRARSGALMFAHWFTALIAVDRALDHNSGAPTANERRFLRHAFWLACNATLPPSETSRELD
ncbi:MAG: hypothetical protein H0U76_05000 [Ktedonobacteraceae bacterium]|nr:hypothetical protein [Ktedonobacteraceae bacterium]